MLIKQHDYCTGLLQTDHNRRPLCFEGVCSWHAFQQNCSHCKCIVYFITISYLQEVFSSLYWAECMVAYEQAYNLNGHRCIFLWHCQCTEIQRPIVVQLIHYHHLKLQWSLQNQQPDQLYVMRCVKSNGGHTRYGHHLMTHLEKKNNYSVTDLNKFLATMWEKET